MIAWSREEPHRVGEVALLPAGRNAPQVLLGRGEDKNDDPAVRLVWIRQRPGRNTSMPPLKGSGISRKQLLLRIEKGGVRVENIGRCPLTVRGEECSSSQVRPGEALCLDGQLVLLCVRRPKRMPASRSWPQRSVPVFGEADPHGFVGESK